jgi:hypothetical protein
MILYLCTVYLQKVVDFTQFLTVRGLHNYDDNIIIFILAIMIIIIYIVGNSCFQIPLANSMLLNVFSE